MKKYIENIKQLPPHERRGAAMRWALGVTGIIFVGWIATLSIRLATPQPKVAETNTFESQIASVFAAFTLQGGQPNTLEAATTTNY